jgi:proteic killer suppression protein
MIRSYGDKETKRLFEREPSRKIPENIHRVTFRKLRMLHRATTLYDLRVPPGNHLEALEGDRKGQYSIRINDQWRICFVWRNGNAYHVEIVDYHK